MERKVAGLQASAARRGLPWACLPADWSARSAWVRVARKAVGPEGQVVPQQWLAHTRAVGVDARDKRRLYLVIHGVFLRGGGGAHCCNTTLVSAGGGRGGFATYPELLAQGPQRLLVLGSERGGRWNDEGSCGTLHAVAACGPPQLCAGKLSAAVQQAVGSTALGRAWPASPQGPGLPDRWSTCSGLPRMRARAACLRAPRAGRGGRRSPLRCWSVSAGVSPVMRGKRWEKKTHVPRLS